MATAQSTPAIPPYNAVPPALVNVCFVLFVINAVFFPTAFIAHGWIIDEKGLGIPTDFVNVWSAGRLVLDGHPAWAYDWDIQKQVQVAVLGQSYPGNFAWHYPPPFLFVASVLAHFPYTVAFIGWAAVSFVPYLAVMRAIVGRPFGLLLAAAFPVVLTNTLVGQNGFLTASLIGATLYLPRPAQLQAAIWAVVSAGADRSFAMARLLQRRGDGGSTCLRVLARLRHRELAGVLPLDADVLTSLPHRGSCALGQDAKHLRAGAVFRRH